VKEQTRFASGSLRAVSSWADSPTTLYSGSFDLALLVSSWDTRSICVTKSEAFRSGHTTILFFEKRDPYGLRDQHDQKLQEFARQASQSVQPIHCNSLSLEPTWKELLATIARQRKALGRPLHIFLDAAVCPRYYLLATVATALKTGVASRVSVVYADGLYPETPPGSDEDIAFTGGHWRSVAVPSLEGHYSPSKNRFLLVSIGFEGWKTMRAVARSDPDRVSILHGDPGTTPQYAKRSLKDNAALIDTYQIPSEQILRAPASDAVAAWKTLTERAVERPTTENAYFLCSGTKPHSLALALRGLCLRSPAVLYNLPESHKVVLIQPTGRYWRFDIENLTVPQ